MDIPDIIHFWDLKKINNFSFLGFGKLKKIVR